MDQNPNQRKSNTHFYAFLCILLTTVACNSFKISNTDEDPLTDPDGPGGGNPTTGQLFFENTVKPALQAANCNTCHQLIANGGNGITFIYDYGPMVFRLSQNGDNPDYNKVIRLMAGDHPTPPSWHQDTCFNGADQSPCKEVKDWWEIEFGTHSGNRQAVGALNDVKVQGSIYTVVGWAADPDSPNTSVNVQIRIDGNLIGTVPANEAALYPQPGGTVAGDHRFSFTIPNISPYNDGQIHYVTATVTDLQTGASNELNGAPRDFVMILPSVAGENYFNANVASRLQNNCGGCHGWHNTYEGSFAELAYPVPTSAGGTGTRDNHDLITRAQNQFGHGGGSCAGGLCDELRAWWDVEFGP